MYIVRFVRLDGKPDEEYYYQSLQDAQYHLHLFDTDDSGLYNKVILFNCDLWPDDSYRTNE